MRMFRCYNCPNEKDVPGRDFIAEAGAAKCQVCGLDGADKQHGKMIVSLKTVHFDPPHSVIRGGTAQKIACGRTWGAATQVTAHAASVTCPACKATPAWKEASETQEGSGDEFDVPGDYKISETHAA
jgi:hypothetical protein